MIRKNRIIVSHLFQVGVLTTVSLLKDFGYLTRDMSYSILAASISLSLMLCYVKEERMKKIEEEI